MPGREVVLCVDQGTTNTKALAMDATGRVVASASEPTGLSFPRPGWAESDADDMWAATEAACARCLAVLDRPRVLAIGVSNQRESAVVWDRATGRPLGPVISWQCGRSQALCAQLSAEGHGRRVQDLSGLPLSPMFSAGKMAWLIDRVPNGRARAAHGEICLGTVDSWILWNLTGGAQHATDLTNASRTQLLDLATLSWSAELLDLFSIPAAALADVRPSAAEFGVSTLPGAVDAPVCGMAGDSHASLVAHGVLAPGGVKATFGTGTSVLAPVDAAATSEQLSRTIAWSAQTVSGQRVVRALEGNIYSTGGAVEFVAGLLGLASVGELERLASGNRGSATGTYFVPAMSGLGAPRWDASATGTVIGITHGTTSADLARAAFESIAFQVREVLEVLPDIPTSCRLHVDGGAMRSDLLAALVADVTGIVVARASATDLSAVGVGYLAGHQAGLWPDLDDLDHLRAEVTTFEPTSDRDWDAAFARWNDAVERSMGWNTSEPAPGQITSLELAPATVGTP